MSVGTLETSQTPLLKQQKVDFKKTVSQGQIDKAIASYVVESMQPLSTVESPAFRQSVSMMPNMSWDVWMAVHVDAAVSRSPYHAVFCSSKCV